MASSTTLALAPHAELNVWTRPRSDEENWEHHLTTADYAEALKTAQRLGHGDIVSTIYEFGRFDVSGKPQTDQVLCWWSKNFHDAMNGPPIGRGEGWTEQDNVYVKYEAADAAAIALRDQQQEQDDEADEEPAPRYRMIYCDACGREMPQNEAHAVSEDVETGHSSASYRVSGSQSHRSAAHGWSNTSRQGVSRSSGRHFYKRVNKFLCEDCFQEKIRPKESDDFSLTGFLVFLAIAAVIVIGIGIAIFAHLH